MLEHGVAAAAVGEVTDGLALVDALAGVAQLGPAGEVVAVGLLFFLGAELQVTRATRALVGTVEVSDEDFLEVQPGVDAAVRQAV